MQQEEKTSKETLLQLNDDIATAQKLGQEISAEETEKLLAPVDRLQISSQLEHQAAQDGLKNFTYALSPAQHLRMDDPVSGPQSFSVSTLSLKMDAPLDTTIYTFLQNLTQPMTGKVSLKHLILTRAADTLSPTNIHAEIEAEWLSGGDDKVP